ncbi:PREDICTED: regulatory factor X-associated protein [Lipotes vexillifer]|uniref:Regulatory factor X-associated protein n=1 Tax=Lipotes vexillifer TaxID=118797 RepID=A0A340XYR6_LIPVE|nr:PREDICTED: regulatory factor X-associated protein [Lipotes vexillifer]
MALLPKVIHETFTSRRTHHRMPSEPPTTMALLPKVIHETFTSRRTHHHSPCHQRYPETDGGPSSHSLVHLDAGPGIALSDPFVKLICWYEFGYSNHVIDLMVHVVPRSRVGSRQKRCPAQHLRTSSALSKPVGAGGDRAAQHLPPESTAHAQSDPPAAAQLRPSETPGSLKGTERRDAQVLKGWGRGPPPGLSSTEVQAVAEGAGPGAASGALRPGPPAPAPGQARAPTPVPAAASQFTLLVMRPCGGPDEAAAEGVLRQAPALGGSAGAGKPVRYLCEVAGDGEEEAGEDETDLLDTSDPPGGGESTASLEDLEDEETHSGGEGGSGGARRRGSGGGSMSKTCTYEGCSETTSQVAKQRKPWMCKKHRNKMYKDKYKKKKSDQALNCGGAAQAGSAGNVKLEESADNILSIVKQRTGSFGDRPARPTLLEQVLNQKRLSLLRSPEVVQFLQKQQQLLNQQVLEQRQQQFPGTSV